MFRHTTWIYDDTHNNVPGGEREVFLSDWTTKDEVAHIRYRPAIGQIGMLWIDQSKYAGCGIGTQLLMLAMSDMQARRTREVWAVASADHPYWTCRLRGFRPRDPAHPSVGASGFFRPLCSNALGDRYVALPISSQQDQTDN
jgi:hypothetical protein